MKRRCYSKSVPKYKNYGDRGITVCKAWLGVNGFATFLEDMGTRPSLSHTLNRIDNDGNYEPGNCEWATIHTQMNNRTISNKTGGVYEDNNPGYKNKWNARLTVKKKLVFYGRYATEAEAITARKFAEIKYLGATIQPLI